ncbi:MAG: PilZ domain-containing protein [Bacteroides sp.]|nr:PilZ domain-containing protein [Eubacterium sp.]MCM1418608.1 PilZ domain-containing protein [Roseburia sp.]MCM1462662.1 PilZ domain-containing protein [Bacteroides sp.]
MLDRDRIIKVELTSAAGEILIRADRDQLSYPKMFVNDMPSDNIVIIKGKDLPTLSLGQSVFLVAYMKSGDRVRYGGSIGLSLPHQTNVRLIGDLGTVMPERRRYFKVDTDLNCIVNGFTRAGEEYEYEIPLAAVIRNISIGGIFLMCTNQKFSIGDTLYVNFKVEGELIRVEARVLREQRGEDGGIEGYGCQFINTDASLEEQFAKLVNDIQLKRRGEELERTRDRLDARDR